MRYSTLVALAAAAAVLVLTSCSRHAPAQVRTYSVGEKVTAGHLVYTVFESGWVNQLPTENGLRSPKNRFLLVRLNVVSGLSNDVVLPNLTLEDENGNTFDELQDGDGVPQWAGFLRKARPAEALQGTIAFDVPTRRYLLRVVDENGDSPALIDLPLTFQGEPSSDVRVPQKK